MFAFFSSSSATNRSLADASGSSRMRAQLREVAGPQEVRDVAHRLGREQRSAPRARPRGSGGRRPRTCDTPSVVSSRYGVSSWPERQQLLVLRSRHGRPTGRRRYRRDGRHAHDRRAYPHRARLHGRGRVPDDARWGAQTQRAVENFPISGRPIERALDRSAGRDQGRRRDGERAAAVSSPKDDGRGHPRRRRRGRDAAHYDDHFPIDVFQTGSGTSSNMNMNEVLATLGVRATRRGRCTRTTT